MIDWQIKNAVSSAVSLTRSEGIPLAVKDVEELLDCLID